MAISRNREQPFDESRHKSQPDGNPEGRSLPCSCGLEHSLAPLQVYNEEAFRYFLDIERRRAEISNRPFLLLLLDLKRASSPGSIDGRSSDRLFAALGAALRETDFLGWYRASSVIGAVLTQHSDSAGPELQDVVRDRIADLVRGNLPSDLAARVQLRLYRLPRAVHGA
jgi:hypothetical protein